MKRVNDFMGRALKVQAVDKDGKVLRENATVYWYKGEHVVIIKGEKRKIITKIYDYSNVVMVE